jgi:hypothetical protein
VGATSSSLVHAHELRMAGYNVYDISDDGQVTRVSARVLEMGAMTFAESPVPLVPLHERGIA